MRTAVSVIGSGVATPEEAEQAREVGRLVAERGHVLITGGRGGVMEAASRGASEAGGLVVGVLPGLRREDANPFVDVVLTTGLSEARNLIVATSAHAVVAVGGGLGTLSEIAFALKHGVPVVGLGTWRLDETRLPGAGVRPAATPAEAVRLAEELIP